MGEMVVQLLPNRGTLCLRGMEDGYIQLFEANWRGLTEEGIEGTNGVFNTNSMDYENWARNTVGSCAIW